MNREDDKQLWDLLGRTSAPQLSPFFSRNVLRAIRRGPERPGWFRTTVRWLMPASAVAAVLLAGLISLHRPGVAPKQPGDVDVVAKIDPQDYEVVADLDDLLASDENTLWDDNQTL